MMDKTPESIGPGSYKINEAFRRLNGKKGTHKMQKQQVNEGYFEIVNNAKVFQPKYLNKKERQIIEKAKAHYGCQLNESKLLFKGLRQKSCENQSLKSRNTVI